MLRLVYSNGSGYAQTSAQGINALRVFNSVREYSTDFDFPAYETAASNSNKTFDTTQALTFSNVNGFDLTDGITIKFDTDCCREMKIKAGAGAYVTVEPTGTSFHYQPTSTTTNTIFIQFTKTKYANQKICVNDVALGDVEYTEFSEFINIELIEQCDILSLDLPMNELDFTVISDFPLQIGKKVSLYSNDAYYGTFKIDSAQPTAEGAYECVALNTVNDLEKSQYENCAMTLFEPGVFLYDLIHDIQTASHTIIDYQSTTTIDDGTNRGLRGYIPITTCRRALAQMAWALGYMLITSRSDIIRWQKIPTQTSRNFTDASIIGQSVLKESPIIASANYYRVETGMLGQSTNNIKLPAASRTKFYFDNAPAVPEEEEGLTIGGFYANYFYYTCSTQITTRTISADLRKKITVIQNDNAPPEASNIANFDFDCVGLYNMSREDLPSVSTLYPVWFNGTPIDRTADIKKYIQSKGTVQARIIIPNNTIPVKPGDRVTVTTAWQGTVRGIITKMTTHFGYQDTSDIEVFNFE